MIKPLSIFLYVFVTAAIAGCGARHVRESVRDSVRESGGNEGHSQEAPKPGAPHGLATPVGALGIRG
jgi:hypothetical protein